jgi:hypothetical protein
VTWTVRGRWPRRARAAPLIVCVLPLLLLFGCGDTTTQPSWVPSHPPTTLLTFQTTAPGVCAVTVQYPNDAPAVIVYLGGTYVQVSRGPHQASPAGKDLGQSGDWHILLRGNGDLLLVTPRDAFDYRLEASC